MPILPPAHGPRAAWRDFKNFLSNQEPEKRLGLILAVLVTIIILLMFLIDPKVNTEAPPTVVYTESWSANRTDEEIIADQIRDQAEREARDRARQEQYRELGRAVGMDEGN